MVDVEGPRGVGGLAEGDDDVGRVEDRGVVGWLVFAYPVEAEIDFGNRDVDELEGVLADAGLELEVLRGGETGGLKLVGDALKFAVEVLEALGDAGAPP